MVDNVTEYIIRGSLTPQSVVDILRNLQYRNMKDEPTSYTRSIEITVSDCGHTFNSYTYANDDTRAGEHPCRLCCHRGNVVSGITELSTFPHH